MNQPPIYKISGKERIKLKQELSKLKYSVKMFWFCEDVDRVYGGGMSDNSVNNLLDNMNKEILELEHKLSIKLNRKDKLQRILNEK